jgi:hypothetical protein
LRVKKCHVRLAKFLESIVVELFVESLGALEEEEVILM